MAIIGKFDNHLLLILLKAVIPSVHRSLPRPSQRVVMITYLSAAPVSQWMGFSRAAASAKIHCERL